MQMDLVKKTTLANRAIKRRQTHAGLGPLRLQIVSASREVIAI
jgi:hypothetical protein